MMLYQPQSRSFAYRKAQAWQEKGGKTWRVINNLVRHSSHDVTFKEVAGGLKKDDAVSLSRRLNSGRRVVSKPLMLG